MSDLRNFLRVVAVTERVTEDEQKRLIAMSKDKAIEGVSVDEQRSRVRVNCAVLAKDEIKPLYQIPEGVSWFKISCSETKSAKSPRIGVVSDVGTLFPAPLDDYLSVVSFRNGTVVRAFANRRLLADYVGVRKEGQSYFLVVDERLDFLVPGYVQDREIPGFLQGRVPADLLEISVDLLRKAVSNPEWVNGLQSFKGEPSRREMPDRRERGQDHGQRPERHSNKPAVKPGMSAADVAEDFQDKT